MEKEELLKKLKEFNDIGFELNNSLIDYYGSELNRPKRLAILKSLSECHSIARDICGNDDILINQFKDVWPLEEESR